MNLFLKKSSLLLIQYTFLFELTPKCFFCNLEVIFHYHEWILKDVL